MAGLTSRIAGARGRLRLLWRSRRATAGALWQHANRNGLGCVLLAAVLAAAALFASPLPLTLLPLYLTWCSWQVHAERRTRQRARLHQLVEEHVATAEALAMAIEARDRTTHSHVRRVQQYACALAEAAGLHGGELQGVRTAALLHDIGKLGVPEQILSKPGPLTADEFDKIRQHPRIGADIIAAVPFPYPVATLILCHHERWDGSGYPAGCQGEAIPLGARIISIADCFDALMEDRPYHKAMSIEDATALLRREAGKALDPTLVEIFVALVPRLQQEIVQSKPARRAPLDRRLSQPAPEPARDRALGQIALAHGQLYALYEIAQAMGTSLSVTDTMALIAGKLSNLVPFSCAALFVVDDTADALRCRFATGVDAGVVRNLRLRNGDLLAGGGVFHAPVDELHGSLLAGVEASHPAPARTLQEALVCPLIWQGRTIGALVVYHVDRHYYRDEHSRLLERVAEPAATALGKALLFEHTREDSLTDVLTGLPNRRFLSTQLAAEIARARRSGSELGLLVMDLDNFKQINDGHGHQVGDRALREVARVLRGAVRPYDICVRYAGDEFIVVLSGCGAADAARACEELQRVVDGVVFEARRGKRVELSISVGAAIYPADGLDFETLLVAADCRMYDDKCLRRRRPSDAVEQGAGSAARARTLAAAHRKRISTRAGAARVRRCGTCTLHCRSRSGTSCGPSPAQLTLPALASSGDRPARV